MPVLTLGAARQQASEKLSTGDIQSVLSLAEAIAQTYPRDYGVALLTARAYLARGEHEKARPLLEHLAALLPDRQDIRRFAVEAGADQHATVLKDLPPLHSSGEERAPISPAALGHLFLRQDIPALAALQLEPLWQARRQRLDLGLALAEAWWRLGNRADDLLDLCHALRELAPDCLKANLIEAQILFQIGRKDEAAARCSTAEALDPENETAELLYGWLIARNPALVPLRARAVEIELPDPTPSQPAMDPSPENVAPPKPASPSSVAATADDTSAADLEGVLVSFELDQEKPDSGNDWAERTAGWTATWTQLVEQIGLGAVRYGVVESAEGILHLQPDGPRTGMTVTTPEANLGLIRLRLRRQHEHQPEEEN